ncbi:hypothetical protein [Lichenibacterium ramalinae]|uniref:Uncharacterized protein n=1 Tax=Lichenibacterium ramalinae TaxID=2316527 RepID=A0A4Q2RAS4_9HYPH|nr:hypothetical protein [Lichenibacterium ramalinae]RYB03273.1 hypothetical protein D3272_17785 [Lichenibacterium ramalinae]
MLPQKNAVVESQASPADTAEARIPELHAGRDGMRSMILALRPAQGGSDGGRPFGQVDKVPAVPDQPVAGQPADPKDNALSAFDILEDVKNFIPNVMRENDRLRHSIVAIQSQAEKDILTAETMAHDWKSLAESFKSQITTLEAMVLDLRSKLQTTEFAAAADREIASKSMQDAAEAECLSKLFEDKVISSFGIGTMFQDALARIGRREDA